MLAPLFLESAEASSSSGGVSAAGDAARHRRVSVITLEDPPALGR